MRIQPVQRGRTKYVRSVCNLITIDCVAIVAMHRMPSESDGNYKTTFFWRRWFEFRNKLSQSKNSRPFQLDVVYSLAAPKLNERATKMRMSSKNNNKKHQLISLKRFANGFFRTFHKHVRTLSPLFTQCVNKSRLAGHGIWRWSTPQPTA